MIISDRLQQACLLDQEAIATGSEEEAVPILPTTVQIVLPMSSIGEHTVNVDDEGRRIRVRVSPTFTVRPVPRWFVLDEAITHAVVVI